MGNSELMELVVGLAKKFDANVHFIFSGDFKACTCEETVESVTVVWKSKDGLETIDCGPVPQTLARLRALPEDATKEEVMFEMGRALEFDESVLPDLLKIHRRLEDLESRAKVHCYTRMTRDGEPMGFSKAEMEVYHKGCEITNDLKTRIEAMESDFWWVKAMVWLWLITAALRIVVALFGGGK